MGKRKLDRKLGLLGLAATGICSMMGASIYVVPFMIQRHVPGIGPYVLPAFIMAAIPAALAALAYASLSTAMPRAGGSYIYASRGLHPYLGFVASFAQWFGLSIAIGVISYIILPFVRDIADTFECQTCVEWLSGNNVRLVFSLLLLWSFVLINLQGLRQYRRVLIPMMVTMFALGFIVILAGFIFTHADFTASISMGEETISERSIPFKIDVFLSAAAILFSSFIGFDSIAQAGGEAIDPRRFLPRAIGLAFITVGVFYFVFAASVYHAVPWQYIAVEAMEKDVTAPGLFKDLLPSWLTVLVISGAAVALINDLPAMLLSVSRLFFAWAKDGIFPAFLSRLNGHHVPSRALIISGLMASVGIIGSHLAGDFFLGVDIMVTSMLVNFLLMCITVLTLKSRNPKIYQDVGFLQNRFWQRVVATLGIVFLSGFLLIHIYRDISTVLNRWYLHSTYIWVLVMGLASLCFFAGWRHLIKRGVDVKSRFSTLPDA